MCHSMLVLCRVRRVTHVKLLLLTRDCVTVFFISLDPKEAFVGMFDLRLVAYP